MSVYVDGQRHRYRGMVMCHMLADTAEELLAMADRIGVARRWIQAAGTWHEHFDICLSKRALAVAAGAEEIGAHRLFDLLSARMADEAANNRQRSDYSPASPESEAATERAGKSSGISASPADSGGPTSAPCAFHTEDTAQPPREPGSAAGKE